MVAARAVYVCGLAVLALLFASKSLQNAIAEGETRTISMHHIHTDENITITYKRDGRYDEAALEKLNWFLRDWRRSEETRMDPHLIDLVWEVQREADAKEPIQVVCGYRSPQTNAMLRHRSSGVARFSQHMLGRAMDYYIPGVPLSELRALGMRLQRGGVGFYPESGSPFVHMDTGTIRHWPRMTRQELARVFPDGRTVHIPTDGRPLEGYAVALAEIRARGNSPSENSLDAARNAGINVGSVVAVNERSTNPFAKLLGLGKKDDDEDDSTAAAASGTPAPKTKPIVVAAIERAAAKTAAVAESAASKTAAAAQSAAAKTAAVAETAAAKTAAVAENAAAQTAAAARATVAAAPKLIENASLSPVRPAAAKTLDSATTTGEAGTSPNQIISSRGYWQGQPDVAPAPQITVKSGDAITAALRNRTELADAGATGAVGNWPAGAQDRVPPQLALAYAELPPPRSDDTLRAASEAAEPAPPSKIGQIINRSGVTVAAKGLIERPKTAFQTATRLASAAVVKVRSQADNPWLRAIVLSPSVHRFLTTLALGARDFTSLAALMVKPSSSVMMTFSSDPNIGLSHDRFSGKAVVFVPTVNYTTRTAALQ